MNSRQQGQCLTGAALASSTGMLLLGTLLKSPKVSTDALFHRRYFLYRYTCRDALVTQHYLRSYITFHTVSTISSTYSSKIPFKATIYLIP